MGFLASNMKVLRRQHKLTQEGLARELGLNRPVIAAYEESRAEPKSEVLLAMSSRFGVNVETLLSQDLRDEVPLTGRSGPDVLTVVVHEDSGRERIPLVPLKAAASYLSGYADPDFISTLPVFDLPFSELSREGSYRLFQVQGDSMIPVPSGAYIIGAYEDQWSTVRKGQCCVFVTREEGIVYKRVAEVLPGSAGFILSSDNPVYPPFEVRSSDLAEVWKARGFVSFELPEVDD